ncbi:MAG: ADP-ribosylglycohydrolase family protein, partial [Thermoanaerobaculia bacterium]
MDVEMRRLDPELHHHDPLRIRFLAQLPLRAMPDARETVPVALSLFYLANGDPRQTILYGANFGRDADTIASMAG